MLILEIITGLLSTIALVIALVIVVVLALGAGSMLVMLLIFCSLLDVGIEKTTKLLTWVQKKWMKLNGKA